MFDKILVLAPHRDDDLLGCGGFLSTHLDKRIHIHYFNNLHPTVPVDVYDQEALNVKEALACTVSYSKHMCVNELNQFPITLFITEIENLLNTYRPDTLFIPFPSYNQDHRTVYDAAITACRTSENWLVEVVLLYEQPETHSPTHSFENFTAQLFIPIGIEDKLKLYSLYQSQIKAHRSLEHVKALATMRGMQCGVPYAEAFQIVRMVCG